MPTSLLLHPWRALKLASDAVPAVRYAIGLVGIAAALSLIQSFVSGFDIVGILPILIGAIIAMTVLAILSAVVASPANTPVANTFLWATCIFVIVFMFFTVTAVAVGWPAAWADMIFRGSATSKPLLVTPSEYPDSYSKPDGKIEKVGDIWVESDPRTGKEFKFEEVSRSEDETLVLDRDRQIYLSWPTRGGMARWSKPNPVQWTNLYYLKPI